MIPNVWMVWCHRTAKCKYCEEDIELATPMVVARFWNKGDENRRSWNISNYYHPLCWVDNGLDYLRMNPYSPNGKKRGPKVTLSDEDRRERFLLIRRYHGYKQRISDKNRERLEVVMEDIMLQLLPLGGVPKGWLE